MTGALADLIGQGREALALGFVVFLRVGAAMVLLPAFGERSIPERVRLVLALAFTVVVAPAVADDVAPHVTMDGRMAILFATETLAGLALGLALRLFVLALSMAGSMAAQATSLSQILGDVGAEPSPAIGHLMVTGGLALAVMLGLHVQVAEFLIYSYEVLLPGRLPGAGVLGEWGIERIAAAFALAFSLAAPFTIASFIYNLALGVINRAMPQLMVAMVGAPAITLGGMVLLLMALPILLGLWSESFFGFMANPFGG
jgi:flagellar biosynthetic protein FliR